VTTDPFGIVGTTQSRVFRVEAAMAEGGFGVVYRAYHEAFRSYVALKCLKVPDTLTTEQKVALLEKFRNEAELLFRLSAALPEIVRPLQFGSLELADGTPGTPTLGRGALVPYLAMEWLEGETLESYVEKRAASGKPPLTLSRTLDLLTPVARALSRAHDFRGPDGTSVAIIHRDLKPENIFLCEIDGEHRAKILDFGIAKIRADASAMLGRSTGVDPIHAFSPAYASPEQWNPSGFGATGPWTDVYGLALIVTQVLIGRPPIGGDMTSMMGAALDKDFRPTPSRRGLNLAGEADRVLERALSVDPRSRTQSVEALWTQLELANGREPSLTRRQMPSLVGPSVPPPPELTLEADLPVASVPAASAVPRSAAVHVAPPSVDELPASGGAFHASGLSLEVRPRSASGEARRGPPQVASGVWRPESVAAPSRSLGERFSGPLWVVAIAVALGLVDLFFLKTTGSRLTLGPAHLFWVSAPLAGLGLTWTVIRLIQD
jgi:eukaryotic-like serine/threonine-protein kinase